MLNFIAQLKQQLNHFSADLQREIHIESDHFIITQGSVARFIEEIEQTAALLASQTDSNYSEYYAQRLIQQFDTLKQAVEKQKKSAKTPLSYRSSYRFPKNVHHLPIEKRLVEYKKALRALNEKLAWLSEQSFLATSSERANYVRQIEETEYRKQKCLAAIEELEQQALKKR